MSEDQQDYTDFMADEITILREQVEKLTAERDAWKIDAIKGGNAGYLREQIAALAEQNEKLKARCAELEKRNSAWRNGGYTSLWKLRTEDRDRTIESQRCVLSDLRDRLAELYAEHSKSEEEWETHDQDRDRYLNDVGDVLGQDDIDESLIDAAKRVVAELAEAKMYKPALRTSQHSQPVRSHVNPDFPGDGKPRLAFFGIDETDEKFAERAGTKIVEDENA